MSAPIDLADGNRIVCAVERIAAVVWLLGAAENDTNADAPGFASLLARDVLASIGADLDNLVGALGGVRCGAFDGAAARAAEGKA